MSDLPAAAITAAAAIALAAEDCAAVFARLREMAGNE